MLVYFYIFVIGFGTVAGYRRVSTDPTPKPCQTFGPPSQAEMKPVYNLGILAYDGVEVLDYAGPFEVFALTGELFKRIKVHTFGTRKVVTAMNGFKVVVDHDIKDRRYKPRMNILVVPGSNRTVVDGVINSPWIMNWVKSTSRDVDYLISVCTGAMIIGRAGLVDGLDITTHAAFLDILPEYAPNSQIHAGRRFTDNGRVLTSAGISAGIDVSLYFVKRMFGKRVSDRIVQRMEYDWKDWEYNSCEGPIRPNTQ